jgi:cytochrome c oxidase subunit 2
VRRKLLALALVVFAVLATAGLAAAANGGFTPQHAHSPNAHRITDAYWLVMGFTVAIFVLVESLLVTFIVKYRARGRARTVEGSQVHGHHRLEAIWTAIPIAIIAIIFSFVFYKLPGIASAPKATAASGANIAITVDAHTFYWQFTYPNGATSIDELHLPVGKVAELTILSEDVNHSWWIPQLGGKTDAIAGRTNHTWYEPDKTGTFYGQCAEFCGLFHERMLGRVVVTSEAEYQSFISAGAAKQLGKAEWVGVCAKCHGMQGQGDYGPALASNPILTQKSSLEDLLRKGGTLMPAVGNNWSDTQMRALETYLEKSVYKGASASGS